MRDGHGGHHPQCMDHSRHAQAVGAFLEYLRQIFCCKQSQRLKIQRLFMFHVTSAINCM